MRRVLIGFIGLMLIFAGCTKRWEEEWCGYTAPNWTSDNKIIFMRDHYIQKYEETMWIGGIEQVGGHQEIYVCEIDVGGSNFREVVKIVDEEFERGPDQVPISTSSAGEYVVISKEDWTKGEHYTEMFIMKRDGTGLKNLGEGSYPDLSPDGKRIVYQKPNQGLWIKNIDGSGDRQILPEGKGVYPAWSPDCRRIAFVSGNLYIMDTSGSVIDSVLIRTRGNPPDWGPLDSNAVCLSNGYNGMIIHLSTNIIDTLQQISIGDAPLKWSPDGQYFIAYDGNWYIIKFDGSLKWYLKP